jgi:pimeloyl-ACP methyl ester carboxylesterase
LQTIFLPYKNSVICIGVMGKGPELIVCLHGYGESKTTFALFEKHMGKDYTFLCIDFPFHGETEWNDGLLFSHEDFLNILEASFAKIGFYNRPDFSLLTFSLGGRLALCLLQTIPVRIKRAVLVAPDGLHVNFWYWLGTQTYFGNKLFYITMQKPSWFFAMIKIANKTGLLNKTIVKLVHYYLDDEAGRVLLYNRWTVLRKFKPALKAVKKNIALYTIAVRFVFGKYDRIIPDKHSNIFKDDVNNVRITVLETGHKLLKENYVNDIVQQFSK